MKNTIHRFNSLSKNKKVGISAVAAALLAGGLVIGCSGGGGDSTSSTTTFIPLADPVVVGTDLFCNGVDRNPDGTLLYVSVVADDFNASQVIAYNVSGKKDNGIDDNTSARLNPNAANTLVRMGIVTIDSTSASGEVNTTAGKVHPLLISYAEQVVGDYELGDGSADIGDPYHWDDIFVSLSRDEGKTWKKYNISDNFNKLINERSSIDVAWDLDGDHVLETGEKVAYPPHSHKPTMNVSGNNILVAWHSKYCPTGNPLGLTMDDTNTTYPTDYFKVNGDQGSILYTADDGSVMIAPNDKYVYEVPFSCIWTARGIFNEDNATNPITWMKPQQLTSGMRDANKITIAEAVPGAGSPAGFAISWQEDPEGLRSGGGEGPGDGWSGATTNHGADIWYSMITMGDFVLNDGVGTRPTALNTFSYPVRITDNEACKADGTETKLYCQAFENNPIGTVDDKQYYTTGDLDMLINEPMVLNGDTGASRPVIKLLRTNASTEEYVVVLGYEETKGMSENQTSETNIELEGKSVYFETFPFKKIVTPTTDAEFNALITSLPMVSSGNIINVKVPEVVVSDDNITTTPTGDMIYENARRLTFIPQIDPCEDGKYTYGWLYKQGIFTQGGSSDMYVRFNDNFDAVLTDPVNVSSYADDNTTDHLADNSYVNMAENSFSPRGFMRGDDIYIGFEYTPDYHPDSGYSPNNFYIRRYAGGAWQPAQNISLVYGNNLSTLDPRFVTTPSGKYSITGLDSDKSNPDVLFMSFGTFDTQTGQEHDLYYTRSTDKGVTWEYTGTSGVTPAALLATSPATTTVGGETLQIVEEKEVQTVPSPDGTKFFNAWLQESILENNLDDHSYGLDTWFGVVNYNIPK